MNSNPDNPIIIGLTGSFASGCTYIADKILAQQGFEKVTLSDFLKDLFEERENVKLDDLSTEGKRSALQDFGDKLREENGPEYLAKKALERIAKHPDRSWVVDSIRNPAEIRALREYSTKFFLFGIYADNDQRWERVKVSYKKDRGKFDERDERDKGDDSEDHGQCVADCFYDADVVLDNSDRIEAVGNADFCKLQETVDQYIDRMRNPRDRRPPIKEEEVLMAMAYATSQRSSCMKRKVGAVIVDSLGNVISSGYNEVPRDERPCQKEYTRCYRDHVTDEFFEWLKNEIPQMQKKETQVRKRFRESFKILDYCRALHAEENAILTLARNGNSVPLDKCTLYTTTYPCRMCANKILSVGIGRVVYLEPYPQKEAETILGNADTNVEFFQGVTYRAFFRLYGEQK